MPWIIPAVTWVLAMASDAEGEAPPSFDEMMRIWGEPILSDAQFQEIARSGVEIVWAGYALGEFTTQHFGRHKLIDIEREYIYTYAEGNMEGVFGQIGRRGYRVSRIERLDELKLPRGIIIDIPGVLITTTEMPMPAEWVAGTSEREGYEVIPTDTVEFYLRREDEQPITDEELSFLKKRIVSQFFTGKKGKS